MIFYNYQTSVIIHIYVADYSRINYIAISKVQSEIKGYFYSQMICGSKLNIGKNTSAIVHI